MWGDDHLHLCRIGLYETYTRHQATCAYCSGDGVDAVEAQSEAEKENRFLQLEVDEKGQLLADKPPSPWKEWSVQRNLLRTHTGLTPNMVEWLYERSRESLLQLRSGMHH